MTTTHSTKTVIGAIVLAVVIAIGWSQASKRASQPITPVTVTYEVTGTAREADITYETPSGTSQQSGIDVPMHNSSAHTVGMRFSMTPGAFVYISAQNTTEFGSITCTIREGDRVINTNTSFGEATIATCSGHA